MRRLDFKDNRDKAKKLRSDNYYVENGNVIDKIAALRIGADNYISSPIEPVAFSALAQAFIRRSTEYAVKFENKHKFIQIRNMLIDLLANAVYIDGNEIKLTKTEYDILVFFARHKGQVLDI